MREGSVTTHSLTHSKTYFCNAAEQHWEIFFIDRSVRYTHPASEIEVRVGPHFSINSIIASSDRSTHADRLTSYSTRLHRDKTYSLKQLVYVNTHSHEVEG